MYSSRAVPSQIEKFAQIAPLMSLDGPSEKWLDTTCEGWAHPHPHFRVLRLSFGNQLSITLFFPPYLYQQISWISLSLQVETLDSLLIVFLFCLWSSISCPITINASISMAFKYFYFPYFIVYFVFLYLNENNSF